MSNNTPPKKKLTPLQIIITVAILVVAVFQILTREGDTSEQQHTAETAAAALLENAGGASDQEAGELSTQKPSAGSNKPAQDTPTPKKAAPTRAPASSQETADFDFYVLALSWSPDYCATDGQNDTQQCSLGRKLSFVLHGLWPQYDRGYPSDCSTQKLPANLKAQFPGLYPSDKLYTHEWEKHGTCSGLSPEGYLNLSKQLKESVHIPDAYRSPEQPFRTTAQALEEAFAAANPGLSAASVAPYCSGSGRFLKEIYVCFALDGAPTACSAEIDTRAAKSCGQPDFLVRNIR